MQNVQYVKKQLNQLLEVLMKEKEALIRNDGNKVIELLEKKMGIMDSLKNTDIKSIETNDQIKTLAIEIKEIQETNLMLTRQALKFQENLIEAVASNLSNIANVYSEKGGYEKANQTINLVDQEI